MPNFLAEAVGIFRAMFSVRLPINVREAEYQIFYVMISKFERFLFFDSRHENMKKARLFANNPGEAVLMPHVDPLGVDRTRRQISYGKKRISFHTPVDIGEDFRPRISKRWSLERGAALVYSRADNYVTMAAIFLPSTDNMEFEDRDYILDFLKPGTNMTSIGKMRKHARYFRSVAERYSFDGDPHFIDFVRCFILRWFYPYIADQKAHPSRINEIVLDIVKWTLTVGLSGFILSWILF